MNNGLPHDIRGLLPYAAINWKVVALIGLVLLAVAALAFLFARRKRKDPVRTKSPWDLLKQRAVRLKPSLPFGQVEQEEYYYQLSLLLREAIELRTQVRATDLTWQELRAPLQRKLPLPPEGIDRVLAFLERADLVKFANQSSDLAEAETYHNQVDFWLSNLAFREETQTSPSSLPKAVHHGIR